MLTIGVDVGGSAVRAGVVDDAGTVLDCTLAETPRGAIPLERTVLAAVRRLLGRHRVAAVGLAVAGFVTADRSRVLFAPHLSWRDAPVAARFAAALGLPVVLEHDANAAGLAEHRFGVARGAGVTVLVSIGTGIGSALLLGGQLFRGAHGVAPELGHLRLVPEGRVCPCGKRGCWELYCSGTALARTAAEMLAAQPGSSSVLTGAQRLTGHRVALAAGDGDPVACEAMAELARWLGEGLALVADVYDPELVVIAGGVSSSAALFLDAAREHYAASVTGAGHRPLVRIRTAQLGEDAAIVGAAELARQLMRSGTRTA